MVARFCKIIEDLIMHSRHLLPPPPPKSYQQPFNVTSGRGLRRLIKTAVKKVFTELMSSTSDLSDFDGDDNLVTDTTTQELDAAKQALLFAPDYAHYISYIELL